MTYVIRGIFVDINMGDKVFVITGFSKGKTGIVKKIEMNSGAVNGWFTVLMNDGIMGLFAGEEIKRYQN